MKRLVLFLLALASAALLFSPRAQAGSFTYNSGDLLLGFRASAGTGSTQDYLIDLGPYSQFTSLSLGQSIVFTSTNTSSLGNIGGDLTNTFGSNWIKDPSLYWGAVADTADSDPNDGDLFGTRPEVTAGTHVTGWNRESFSNQVLVYDDIDTAGADAQNDDTLAPNGKDATIQNTSENWSWESYMPGGANISNGNTFNFFQGDIEGAFDSSETTAGYTPLDLFELVPDGTPGQHSAYLGTFTIDSAGDITFTDGTAAVPEPGTYGLLSCGLGLLLLLGRRRQLWRFGR